MLAKSEPPLTAIRRSNDRSKTPSSRTLIGTASTVACASYGQSQSLG
jgi:hypothetical protein